MNVRSFPAVPDGTYHLMAQVTGPAGGSAVAGGMPATLTVAAPFIDLTGSISRGIAGTLRPAAKTSATLLVQNAGNIAARGPASVALFASADTALDASDAPLGTRALRLNLKPGRARAYRLRFALPANLAAGSYYLAASVDSANQLVEAVETNNDAIDTASPFTVSPA
jgi:hypothetical protein